MGIVRILSVNGMLVVRAPLVYRSLLVLGERCLGFKVLMGVTIVHSFRSLVGSISALLRLLNFWLLDVVGAVRILASFSHFAVFEHKLVYGVQIFFSLLLLN